MSLPARLRDLVARDVAAVVAAAFAAFAPPPNLPPSAWAEEFRFLSPEASASQGKWRGDRAPYQRAMLDAVLDPLVETVVLATSAQVGKTEIVNNLVGYFIDQRPRPMLVVQPTIEMAQAWSKDRLAPMIRDCPVLTSKVREVRSKDGGNTILQKQFDRGVLTIASANSAASLASRPVGVVLLDEVDRFPVDVGGEGDPVSLAFKRCATWWDRKRIMVSTPTHEKGRIWKAWEQSDRRRYHVPCPECGAKQPLEWANVQVDEEDPEASRYACGACGVLFDLTRHKAKMLAAGEWVAEAPGASGGRVAGFHLNQLYSPFLSLADTVREYLEKRRDGPEGLKTFKNTALGLPWTAEDEERPDTSALMRRLEDYPAPVPYGVAFLTAGVDVQDNRLELAVRGWGLDGESWLVGHWEFRGNPEAREPWDDLDRVLLGTFRHESGAELRIDAAFVDSGGHHTQRVYEYARLRAHRRVCAVKGSSSPGAAIVKRSKSQRAALFLVGTDAAKDRLFARLQITTPGPGFVHFPASTTEAYLQQIMAERPVLRRRNGQAVRVYEKVSRGVRNEALDLEVYALAAWESLRATPQEIRRRLDALEAHAHRAEAEEGEPSDLPASPAPAYPPRPRLSRRPSFVRGRAW